jgi:ubiquinone/menaquinone biosynthesis C-methylase UbiE
LTERDAYLAHQWEALAERDPFWASCTSGKRHVEWDVSEFLATGEREVAWAIESAKSKGIYPHYRSLAVDFGCGPGRFTGALTREFERVIGVDISPSMLNAASRIHTQASISFAPSTDVVEDGSASLIYCTFVLQHLTQEGRDSCLRDFARMLGKDGLLIFQYPAKPRRTPGGLVFTLVPPRIINAAQRYILRYPGVMPMSWMKPSDVSRHAVMADLAILDYRTGPEYSPNWVDIWYFARKDSVA